MLRGGWFELPVRPKMILGPSEDEDAGERDRFVHVGIPAIRKQLHDGVSYVLTPWFAPLGGFHHDAFADVAFAALRGRLTQDRERKTRGGRGRRRLLHSAGRWRWQMQKSYVAQPERSGLPLELRQSDRRLNQKAPAVLQSDHRQG